MRLSYTALFFVIIAMTIASCGVVLAFWSAYAGAKMPTIVTPSASETPAPLATLAYTEAPSATPTYTPSVTPSATNTATLTSTLTPLATNTTTLTSTFTPSATSTATSTSTPTPSPMPSEPIDPTPTREVWVIAPTPSHLVLQSPTYVYDCASEACSRRLLPKGTIYEIWDAITNDGWYGIAVPVTDYLYLTFWVRKTDAGYDS